ncbi:hypothetical protein LIER_08538 [Lithospermum erythrorhizon]|uniref:Retrovirus-related Pol polyprotein from transposon TNT 1-94-like beta-barrel domain-containing protein n=1 Tax=Lithospermum erythrorhizon TaxID=34254 RepID=A0AAV3PF61_LITER
MEERTSTLPALLVMKSNNLLSRNAVSECDMFGSWIIDSGASMHVCGYIKLFPYINNIPYSTIVKLPDNTTRKVQSVGTVTLRNGISLLDCLYLPCTILCMLAELEKILHIEWQGERMTLHIEWRVFPNFCY